MMHRGVKVDPAAIRRVALLTVEGENDAFRGLARLSPRMSFAPTCREA